MPASGSAYSDGRSRKAAETSSDRIGFLGGTLFALSILFFGAVNAISSLDPGYFDRLLLSAMRDDPIDPIETGSTVKDEAPGIAAISATAILIPRARFSTTRRTSHRRPVTATPIAQTSARRQSSSSWKSSPTTTLRSVMSRK